MAVAAKCEVRIASSVPETKAIRVLGGGYEPPILGKRRQYRGSGWYRSKSVGEFLYALHSKFSSIFTCFRDIVAFVLQHTTFPTPTLV